MASAEFQQVLMMMKAQPATLDTPDVAVLRAGMDGWAAMNPVPDDVMVTAVDANGVPGEWISAPGAVEDHVVLYVHGGGYVIGSVATHRDIVSRISRESGARCLSLDYRMGPENPFPAAVDDAVTGYRWLREQGVAASNIAIAGDSAGGGLTMATLLALRDAGDELPACAVCLSPWVDLEMTGASMDDRHELDPMVHRKELTQMANWYLGGQDPKHPYASPIHADLSGLPPILIQVGTAETLYDDSTRLAERAGAAGVDVTFEPWEEMIHVFQSMAVIPEARQAVARIGEYLKAHLGERTLAPA